MKIYKTVLNFFIVAIYLAGIGGLGATDTSYESRIIILGGTSSSGKTTTALALEKRIKQRYPNAVIVNTGFDALTATKEGEEEIARYLNEVMEKTGLRQKIIANHNFKDDIKIRSPSTYLQLTSDERAQVDNVMKKESCIWKHNKLANFAEAAFKENHFVILDVLDAMAMKEALLRKGISSGHIQTVLLYVPFTQYGERVKQRNQKAMLEYHNNPELKGYENAREIFFLIGQYGNFFELRSEPSFDQSQLLTQKQLNDAFEGAYQDYVVLMNSLKEAHKNALKTGNLTEDEYNQEATDIDNELNRAELDKLEKIEKMIKALNPFGLNAGYLSPKQNVDLILDTTSLSTDELVEKICRNAFH